MILEQNVSYWVSLAPFSEDGSDPPPPVPGKSQRHCSIFPLHFMNNPKLYDTHLKGVENFVIHKNNPCCDTVDNISYPYINTSFDITGYYRKKENLILEFKFNKPKSKDQVQEI